jgi:GT2 family glycosyltransferase
VPFAHWLVQAIRPRIILELGTHHGVSYSAFCESVCRARLDTRCYAVDTWTGDEPSGSYYGRDVFDELRDFHDSRYSAFSELLPMRFDDALAYFGDESVDLLHIDGCHSYDAIRHDFSQWRQKLSQRSVVLFHHTNVGERDFGVWRFWKEISEVYPSFEFLHGHGLGVLFTGRNMPTAVAPLSTAGDPETINIVRDRFATLGQRFILEFELAALRAEMGDITSRLDVEVSRSGELQKAAEERADTIHRLEQNLQSAADAASRLKVIAREYWIMHEGAVREKELAIREKELALREKELATREKELAIPEKELAVRERELAVHERDSLTTRLAQVEESSAHREAYIHGLLRSGSWRVTAPARVARTMISLLFQRARLISRALAASGSSARNLTTGAPQRRLGAPPAPTADAVPSPVDEVSIYRGWIKQFDRLTKRDTDSIQRHMAATDMPALLVVLQFSPASQRRASAAVAQLRRQIFGRWVAVLCFHETCNLNTIEQVKAEIGKDDRFIVVQTPLAGGARCEIDRLSNHAWMVVGTGEVMLREHTLYMFAATAYAQPNAQVIYSDQDRLTSRRERYGPYFKAQFSPELFSQTNFLGPCVLLRNKNVNLASLVDETSAPNGLARVVEDAVVVAARGTIVHIPFVLYHVDEIEGEDLAHSNPGALHSRQKIGAPLGDDSVCAHDIKEEAKELPIQSDDENLPTVTVIIPTKDNVKLLRQCVSDIRGRTSYPAGKLEIVVVDNCSADPETLAFLDSLSDVSNVVVLKYQKEFNYSHINNSAARIASGEILVLLNNDTGVIDPNWLRHLVHYASQDGVGAVGPKLLYPDRRIQHGGVVIGIGGVAGHVHVGIREAEGGYCNLANLTHEVSAVTGACLAIRKTVYWEVGGLDPELAVAFNDVLLCLAARARGYRSIFVAHPLMYHLESKTRGFDNTPEKAAVFRQEAAYVRRKFPEVFKDDPYYNPNLSLYEVYGLAFPTRRSKPWREFTRKSGDALRILMLSCAQEIGHGVAVVLQLQAAFLLNQGYEVYIGGPMGKNEFAYEGCQRIYLDDPRVAATFAVEHDFDCVVAHTPPFFSTVRWLGHWPKFMIYDYGEPNPDFFPDSAQRKGVLWEKNFCISCADRTYAISEAVRLESRNDTVEVIPLGNSHLAVWSDDLMPRRACTRAKFGWDDKIVVLNVCRFHEAERHYKGVDVYASAAAEISISNPTLRSKVVFVLCGKATENDVAAMQSLGLCVFANVSDSELVNLYSAADIYMNFSKWEGYNLGIGQALALGLPVIASDIPAHREFPIFTSDNLEQIANRFWQVAEQSISKGITSTRKPIIMPWDKPLVKFADTISSLCLGPVA